MAELFAHNESIETVFDLIGDRENDITKSIAWAFVKCPRLLEMVIKHLIHISVDAEDVVVRYQEFENGSPLPEFETDTNRTYMITTIKIHEKIHSL